ncbi:unnamed protein product [Caenorhabditis angaria]|uniref:G-protein coupled receptors family 1 profile domain-containing protein n=1 Tax=Caenorhabditis angaria TaxID=860376 RepID=A0A9P1I7H0_9PELO|nr:unnamed protein product [Caenorhabditis angaria]
MHSDNQIDNAIRDVLMIRFGWNIENIAYVGPYLYRNHNAKIFIEKINILNIVGLILMSIILISSIIIIAICAIKCYQKINNYSNKTSERSKSLQFQLFYALVIQTSIPLILMHLPVTILFLCTIFNLNMGYSSGIVNITIALFPSLDPFPVMFVIRSYRNSIFKHIRKVVAFCD